MALVHICKHSRGAVVFS